MNSSAFDIAARPRFVSLAHVETLKWFAVAEMLTEHFYRYALHTTLPGWAEVAGRTVFPLFCFALGVGLQDDRARERRTLGRLAGWFFVAGAASILVRDPLPLNVVGTLFLVVVFRRCYVQQEYFSCAAVILLSFLFEFGPAGVIGGALLMESTFKRGHWAVELGFAIVGCIAVGAWQSTGWPLLAIAVVAVVQGLDIQMPRIRHVFYWIYAAQFPAFALAGQVLS